MNLAERDMLLIHIESQIEDKRAMLLKKQKSLKKMANDNEFLDMVRSDYNKYHNYIMNQKRDQIRAMSLLKDYVDDLMVTGEMTDVDIENAKNDKKILVNEINSIRRDLEYI